MIKKILKRMLRSFLLLFSLLLGSLWAQPSYSGPVSEFAEVVAEVRSCIPFSVTSWFRSDSRNEAVGGAEYSQHLEGLAVDIVLDHEEDKRTLMRKFSEYNYYVIDEGDHIHIGYKDVSTRDSNNAGLGFASRNDENLGCKAREREAKTPNVYGEGWRSQEGKNRSSEREGREVYLDSKSHSYFSNLRSTYTSKGSSDILGYFNSLWLDRGESRISIFHGRQRSIEVAHSDRQHISNNTFGYTHSLSDNWTLLRWFDSIAPIRRYSMTGAWG